MYKIQMITNIRKHLKLGSKPHKYEVNVSFSSTYKNIVFKVFVNGKLQQFVGDDYTASATLKLSLSDNVLVDVYEVKDTYDTAKKVGSFRFTVYEQGVTPEPSGKIEISNKTGEKSIVK